MKQYTESQIDFLFDKLWNIWPNKERGEKAARKALAVLLRSGEDYKKIEAACKAYAYEHAGDEFTYQLNNFFLQDHWKDVYDEIDVELIEQRRQEAVILCETWNKKCRKHWCEIADIESRLPLARKALSNKFFKDNWKKALDKAFNIFKYEFRDGDSRSKIILSFRWFTNVSTDKHTVAKIIEGEYGSAREESSTERKKIEYRNRTKEEIEESKRLFKEVFSEFKKSDKKENAEKPTKEKTDVGRLVEGILDGLKNGEGGSKDADFPFS